MRITLPIALVLLTVVAALHAQETPEIDVPLLGENLIVNGSFELSPVGPVPPGEVPEGWSDEAYGADGQLTIVEDAAPAEGSKALQVTVTQQNPNSGIHGPFIEIDPTQAYIQFGWQKIDASSRGSNMPYGRQWFDADQQGADQEISRSYNYLAKPDVPPGEWGFTQQILLPDPTPDDGKFAANEIPANARYLKVWALAYNWHGIGYYDGLGLYRVDYASMARERILGAMDEADADAIRAEIEAALPNVPEGLELRTRATDLLAEQARISREAAQEQQRPVLDWMADETRTPEMLRELDALRWELKIEALLRAVG